MKEFRTIKLALNYLFDDNSDLELDIKIENEDELTTNDRLLMSLIVQCLSENLSKTIEKAFVDVENIAKEEVEKKVNEKIKEIFSS